MSGHNKWSKIKHKKAITDAQKSKVFSRLTKVLSLESKRVSGDISSPGLATAIERARAANMPTSNIERAIKKGTESGEAQLEAVTYEAYGPGGCAFIIECITDNKKRTAAEMRHALTKQGSSISAPGSALWMFENGPEGLTPTQTITLGEEEGKKFDDLVEAVDGVDGVQDIFTNRV